MSSNSATPATLTYTSLKDRPRLRFALQAAWVLIVLYAAYILFFGVSLHFNRIYSERNLLLQIAQIGLNLFTFSTVNILSDIYILLGYFILAIIIFMRRSDDWFAILLSIIFISFGMRVTNLGDELAIQAYQRSGKYLGIGVASFLHAFDPSIVIFGGGVSQVGRLLFDPFEESLKKRVFHPRYLEGLVITQAQLGDDAGLLGARALAEMKSGL